MTTTQPTKRRWGRWVLQTRAFRSIHNKWYGDYYVNVDRIRTSEELRLMVAHLREKIDPRFDAENAVAALKELCPNLAQKSGSDAK